MNKANLVADKADRLDADSPLVPFARYRLTLAAQAPARLPRFPGSALRGAFGHALKRVVCAMRLRPCAGCMLQDACVYPYLFETPPPKDAEKMRLYRAAPHPYVLVVDGDAPNALEAGGRLVFGVTLVGRAERYAAYVVRAVEEAAERGLGSRRDPFDVIAVDAASGDGPWRECYAPGAPFHAAAASSATVPPTPEGALLRFVTPLRVKVRDRLMTAEGFDPAALIGTIVRRASMLRTFHTERALEVDFRALKADARRARVASRRLTWRDWTRWSSRQDVKMQMGGLVGEVELDISQAASAWPYLWQAQWLHAGKAATMGLGRCNVTAL